MRDELKKGIQDLKSIRLQKGEKADILKSVLNAPIPSPYIHKISLWAVFKNPKYLYAFQTIVLLLVIAGGAVAYNAETALPGENLYFIKVDLSEPLRDFFNTAPADKAEWESIKASRRLEEAADLVIKGELNEEKRSYLENRFNEHVDAFDISVVKAASSTGKAKLIELEFEANISAHAKVLEQLNADHGNGDAKQTFTATAEQKIESADADKGEEAKIKDNGKQREELKKFEKAVSDKLKERKGSDKQKAEKQKVDSRD